MAILIIIVVAIVCTQVCFFSKNLRRMREFRDIFAEEKSWTLLRNEDDSVIGLSGKGNDIFADILKSINKYIEHKTGAEVDFGLIKDSIDRHCDSIENDIASQSPIPLYCGLGGTMLGVIIGLASLLGLDTIKTLFEVGTSVGKAANGINDLLTGVAMAMVASFCGLLFTTINILKFKKCKLEEENGKNAFLVWIQSNLLPEFPADTAEAMNNLVKNLQNFNRTFAQNTDAFKQVMTMVNEASKVIDDAYKESKESALINISVLHQIKESADRLAQFNQYLNAVNGYTEAIHRFETLFNDEADRVHVLENIAQAMEALRDYFNRHKEEIAVTLGVANQAIHDALQQINNATRDDVQSLSAKFTEITNGFNDIAVAAQDTFAQIAEHFQNQLANQLPQFAVQLENVATIPATIEVFTQRIESSNNALAARITESNDRIIQRITESNERLAGNVTAANDNLSDTIKTLNRTLRNNRGGGGQTQSSTPTWLKVVIGGVIAVVILGCCATQVISVSLMKKYASSIPAVTPTETVANPDTQQKNPAQPAVEESAESETNE